MQQKDQIFQIHQRVRPDVVQGEGGHADHISHRPVPAAEDAEQPSPEKGFLHNGGHKHRHGGNRAELHPGHAEYRLVVGIIAHAQQQHDAVDHEIAAPHNAIADQHLADAGPGVVTQGVKIPAEELPQEDEHIESAQGIAQKVCLGLVQQAPEQQDRGDQRQQQHMYRQVDQRRDGLPFGQTACEWQGFSVHQPLAFFCNSKSRFMASMGVMVFRSVSRRMRLTSSAPTSAKLI